LHVLDGGYRGAWRWSGPLGWFARGEQGLGGAAHVGDDRVPHRGAGGFVGIVGDVNQACALGCAGSTQACLTGPVPVTAMTAGSADWLKEIGAMSNRQLVLTRLAPEAMILILVYPVAAIALHLLPTGFNPVTHELSDYANGPYGWLMTAGFLGLGLGSLLLVDRRQRLRRWPSLAGDPRPAWSVGRRALPGCVLS